MFDPANWSEQNYEHVRRYVTSESWRETVLPTIKAQQMGAVRMLTTSPNSRPEPREADDYWRGYIAALEFAMTHWQYRLDQVDKKQEEKPAEEAAKGSVYAETNAPK